MKKIITVLMLSVSCILARGKPRPQHAPQETVNIPKPHKKHVQTTSHKPPTSKKPTMQSANPCPINRFYCEATLPLLANSPNFQSTSTYFKSMKQFQTNLTEAEFFYDMWIARAIGSGCLTPLVHLKSHEVAKAESLQKRFLIEHCSPTSGGQACTCNTPHGTTPSYIASFCRRYAHSSANFDYLLCEAILTKGVIPATMSSLQAQLTDKAIATIKEQQVPQAIKLLQNRFLALLQEGCCKKNSTYCPYYCTTNDVNTAIGTTHLSLNHFCNEGVIKAHFNHMGKNCKTTVTKDFGKRITFCKQNYTYNWCACTNTGMTDRACQDKLRAAQLKKAFWKVVKNKCCTNAAYDNYCPWQCANESLSSSLSQVITELTSSSVYSNIAKFCKKTNFHHTTAQCITDLTDNIVHKIHACKNGYTPGQWTCSGGLSSDGNCYTQWVWNKAQWDWSKCQS